MRKYSIAFILPLSLLAAFSVFSSKLAGENHTSQQYQLDAGEVITVATDANKEPIVPGEGRTEKSADRS